MVHLVLQQLIDAVDARYDRLWFLFQHHKLWFRLQWALKFAFLGCLPAAYLMNEGTTSATLTPPFMTISFLVVTTAPTFGRATANLVVGLKIALVTYALVTIVLAVNVAGIHWLLWGAVFAVGTFLIALTTDFVVTMNSMLMFIIGMMYNFLGEPGGSGSGYGGRPRLMYSSYQVRDVLGGVALGFLSSAFPYKCDEYRAAVAVNKMLASECASVLSKVVEAVFTPSNARRTSLLMVLRRQRRSVEELFAAQWDHTQYAWYEPVNGLHVAELESRCHLHRVVFNRALSLLGIAESLRLRMQADAQVGALETELESYQRQFGADIAALSAAVQVFLSDLLVKRKEDVDTGVLDTLSKALLEQYNSCACASPRRSVTSHRTLLRGPAHGSSDRIVEHPLSQDTQLSGSYNMKPGQYHRRVSSTVSTVSRVSSSDAAPLMATIMGSLVYGIHAIAQDLLNFEEPEVWGSQRKVSNLLLWPAREVKRVWDEMRDVVQWRNQAPQKLVFAVKLAASITSFTSYLLNKRVGDTFFGPAQMAFAAGLDSSKAATVFASQVIGCALGTVVGFAMSSVCHTVTDYVIATTACALFTCFFRSSPDYAVVGIYSQFAVFGSLRSWSGPAAVLETIMTNTLAMSLYVCVQVLFFPATPIQEVLHQMEVALGSVGEALSHCHRVLIQQNRSLTSSFGQYAEVLREHLPAATVVTRQLEACAVAVRTQAALLPSAASQPRLSLGPFPLHEFHKLIEREENVVGILQPLAASWQQIVDSGIELEAPALAAAVAEVSKSAEVYLNHLKRLVQNVTTGHRRQPAAPKSWRREPAAAEFDAPAASVDAEEASILAEMNEAYDELIRCTETLLDCFASVVARSNEDLQQRGTTPPSQQAVSSPTTDVSPAAHTSFRVVVEDAHLLDTVTYSCDALPGSLFDLACCVADICAIMKQL